MADIILYLEPEGSEDDLYRVRFASQRPLEGRWFPSGTLIATLAVESLTEKPQPSDGSSDVESAEVSEDSSEVHEKMAKKKVEITANFD